MAEDDMTPEDRLKWIVKAFDATDTPITGESLSDQFFYETGVRPDPGALRAAIRAWEKGRV